MSSLRRSILCVLDVVQYRLGSTNLPTEKLLELNMPLLIWLLSLQLDDGQYTCEEIGVGNSHDRSKVKFESMQETSFKVSI